jgi:hypothetical protein
MKVFSELYDSFGWGIVILCHWIPKTWTARDKYGLWEQFMSDMSSQYVSSIGDQIESMFSKKARDLLLVKGRLDLKAFAHEVRLAGTVEK